MKSLINSFRSYYHWFGFFLVFVSCSNIKDSKVAEETTNVYSVEKNEVQVMLLDSVPFRKELVSNGKLIAAKKSVLKFALSGDIVKISLKNGDFVKKNRELLRLESFKYKQELDRAILSLKKAKLDLEDMLIGRGYETINKDSIPKEVYEMAIIRSNFGNAERELSLAKFNLGETSLRAPFSGKIANLKVQKHDHVTEGDVFVTLINDTFFDIAFYLIESEFGKVSLNDVVKIIPFAIERQYSGKIISINPQVDENGTILVKARVKNDGFLLEGMNARVLIEKLEERQLVVPKSAVMLRQNQEVLFKVVNGKAFWTYVKKKGENNTYYSIIAHPDKSSASLVVGDTIIIDGNLNLAHDNSVVIKEIIDRKSNDKN